MRRSVPFRARLLAVAAALLALCAPIRAEQPAEQDVRQVRGARYDNPGAPPLADLAGDDTTFAVTHSSGVTAALPASESDAVVVGLVVDAQPYLSNDGTAVYTELLILVEEALKNDCGDAARAGSLIVASREGGALPLPDGRTLRYDAEAGLPGVGARCALFLARDAEADDFVILRAYELRAGVALALDGGPGHGARTTPSSELRFLDRLRNAIVPPR